ncbi:MAG: hypothetical protein A2X45_01725 [Lentisphaerae bacterium GWF2_50_93]|nr:MAG: hypothetical protein A2X45_01725 [Lentisphaerae bacterium GWF2_50_93]
MEKSFLKVMILIFAAMLAAQLSYSQDISNNEKAIEKTVEAQIGVEPALLKLFNRPIIILRSSVFGHSPGDRVRAIEERFSENVKAGKINAISSQQSTEGMLILMDGELLMLFSNKDLDPFSRETMDSSVKVIVDRLEKVLELIRRQKDPKANLIGAGRTLVAILLFAALIIVLCRIQRWIKPKVGSLEEGLDRKLKELGYSSYSIHVNAFAFINKLIYWSISLFLLYTLITFALHQFPYTEPWGRKLGSYIIDIIAGLSAKVVDSLPDLFVVFIIFLITHWFVKISKSFFRGVANGSVVLNWLDPEAALPTSKIFSAIIWIFGIVMAYPYIPGSNTDAFKGIGVFLGLLISLGASSMVGQVIGGMVLMYSRAMKVGEFVQVDQNVGRVMEIGFFSTKLKTMKNEEINIPNSVLMGSLTKNFSRLSKSEGLIIHSSVTIGYDVPWRQVHALLINAAGKTSGVQKKPEPFVIQKSLGDFYIVYEINAFMDKPETYMRVKTELHANIQDEFNKYGVQIMSPNFEAQPPEKVFVPKEKWHEAPAKKDNT